MSAFNSAVFRPTGIGPLGFNGPFTNTLKDCANAIGQDTGTNIELSEYPFNRIHREHGQYVELCSGSKYQTDQRSAKPPSLCHCKVHP